MFWSMGSLCGPFLLYSYKPLDMPFSSSVNTGSNDLELTCCELLLVVPFPFEVWSGVTVHPRLFYVSGYSALI